MASMTDIVFLLLIFFMLTANSPNALDLLLPKAKGKSTNVQKVSVTIKNDLTYFVNDKPIALDQIEPQLQQLMGQHDDPTLMLKAEGLVPHEKVVEIMEMANNHKYRIILAVRPK